MPKANSLSHWARREKLRATILKKKVKRDKERQLAEIKHSGDRSPENTPASDSLDDGTVDSHS